MTTKTGPTKTVSIVDQEVAQRAITAARCLGHAIDRRDHCSKHVACTGIGALLVLAGSLGITYPNPKAVLPPIDHTPNTQNS
ncbi:MAG: hypothetical protein WCO30_01390 [bacterium]